MTPLSLVRRRTRKPRTRNQRIGFAFFWILVVAYAYFISNQPSFNAESHLYLTFSIVDHHSLTIDPYRTRLGDESFWRGHYYSDKAPGLSFLAVPVYAALRTAFPSRRGEGYVAYGRNGYDIQRDTVYLRYPINYVLVIIPSAILTLLLWVFLSRFLSTSWALLLSAVYALGTLAYPYSTWFYSHQVTAVLLFGAFLLLFCRVRHRPKGDNALWPAALAGLLAGYAVISEYPTAVIVVLLFIYMVAVAPPRRSAVAGFVLGLLPPAALNLAYNLAAFGRPLASGYAYVNSGMYHSHPAGGTLGLLNPATYGIQPPSLVSLWEITFGTYRGIFLISPVLLLFAVGLVAMRQRRELRPELWLCAAVVVLYFLLDASRGADLNGWSGGSSIASRHLTVMLPFMIVPIAFALRDRLWRAIFVVLGAISVAVTFMAVASGDQFSIPDRNPLVHEMLPNFFGGHILVNWGFMLGLTGGRSLIPLFVVIGLLTLRIVWLFRSSRPLPRALETTPRAEAIA